VPDATAREEPVLGFVVIGGVLAAQQLLNAMHEELRMVKPSWIYRARGA
jgi:hypothetical protein